MKTKLLIIVWIFLGVNCWEKNTEIPRCENIAHNFPHGTVRYFGDRKKWSHAFYKCDPMYSLFPANITISECTKSIRWEPDPPECKEMKRKVIPDNGYDSSGAKDVLNHLDSYTVSCIKDYELYSDRYLERDSLRITNIDGTFTPKVPECVEERCSFEVSDNTTCFWEDDKDSCKRYNFTVPSRATVNMKCKDGYKLFKSEDGTSVQINGHASIVCRKGSYAKGYKCIQVTRCENIAPDFHNGTVTYSGDRKSLSHAYYKCDAMHSLYPTDIERSECTTSLKWDPDPPECKEMKRKMIPANGYDSPGAKDMLHHLDSYTVSCIKDYELYSDHYLERDSLRITNIDGTFTPKVPECVEERCSFEVSDATCFWEVGKDSCKRYDFKVPSPSTVNMKCKDGYKLYKSEYGTSVEVNGHASIVCRKGFYAKNYKCIPDSFIEKLTQFTSNANENVYSLAENIDRFTCRYLYYVTTPCKDPCLVPEILYGFAINRYDNIVQEVRHGTAISVGCKKGYTVTKTMSTTCRFGEWSRKNFPICIPDPCSLDIATGTSYWVNSRLLNVEAGVTETFKNGTDLQTGCKNGYRTKDLNSQIWVQNNRKTQTCVLGTWTKQYACFPVTRCENIAPDFYNGTVAYSGNRRLWSHAIYSCDEMHSLFPTGIESSECTTSLKWKPDPPECKEMKRKVIPDNGYDSPRAKNVLHHLDSYTIRCHKDYELYSDRYLERYSLRITNFDGTFTPKVPECVEERCSFEVSDATCFWEVGKNSCKRYKFKVPSQSTVNMKCKDGYKLYKSEYGTSVEVNGHASIVCRKGFYAKIYKCIPDSFIEKLIQFTINAKENVYSLAENIDRFTCRYLFYITTPCKDPCLVPEIPYGFAINKYNNFVQEVRHGTGISIGCKKGYTVSKQISTTCRFGEWSRKVFPICIPALGNQRNGCRRSRFGCCPDGVTTARGNNNEGCPNACKATLYGCCDDDLTAAQGPNQDGCDELEGSGIQCIDTDYGCCPDGVTAATGRSKEGCDTFNVDPQPKPDTDVDITVDGPDHIDTDAPEPAPQVSVCEQPKEIGQCRAKLPRWYYNSRTRACQRFYYGGCQGNDNNFERQDECERRCGVVKERKPVCELTQAVGPCDRMMTKYFYNITSLKCEPFTYGGCLGNHNNFETEDRCISYCSLTPGSGREGCVISEAFDGKFIKDGESIRAGESIAHMESVKVKCEDELFDNDLSMECYDGKWKNFVDCSGRTTTSSTTGSTRSIETSPTDGCELKILKGSKYYLDEGPGTKSEITTSGLIEHRTKIHLQCSEHFNIFNNQHKIFLDTSYTPVVTCYQGKWQNVHFCKERCVISEAFKGKFIKDEEIITAGESIAHRESVKVRCGNEFHDSDQSMECNDGKWKNFVDCSGRPSTLPLQLQLLPDQLKHLQQVQNGTTLTVSCARVDLYDYYANYGIYRYDYYGDYDYNVTEETPEQTITCIGDTLTQITLDCPEATTVTTDSCMELQHGSVRKENGYFIVSCDKGYSLNLIIPEKPQCTCENGKLRSKFGYQEPACTPDNCIVPYEFDERLSVIDKDGVSLSGGSVVQIGDVVNMTCSKAPQPIYEPSNRKFRCMNGLWMEIDENWSFGNNGSFPKCREAICNPSCKNGGVCFKDDSCRCREPTKGERCEEVICDRKCLQNGGNCLDPGRCTCPKGRVGTNCEQVICDRKCLQNGGNCHDPGRCTCPKGRVGTNCEQVICEEKCLQTGGNCLDSGRCRCPKGRAGTICERGNSQTSNANASFTWDSNMSRGHISNIVLVDSVNVSQSHVVISTELQDVLICNGSRIVGSLPNSKAAVHYLISVKTAGGYSDGTDAVVYITLHGNSGRTHKIYLQGTFERNDVDETRVEAMDIRPIKSVVVGHDGSTVFQDWKLEYVSIYVENMEEYYVFRKRSGPVLVTGDIDVVLPRDKPRKCINTFDKGHKWYPKFDVIGKAFFDLSNRRSTMSLRECKQECVNLKRSRCHAVHYDTIINRCIGITVRGRRYYSKLGTWDSPVYLRICEPFN